MGLNYKQGEKLPPGNTTAHFVGEVVGFHTLVEYVGRNSHRHHVWNWACGACGEVAGPSQVSHIKRSQKCRNCFERFFDYNNPLLRTCPRCGIAKPAEEYGVDQNSWSGRCSWCKVCKKPRSTNLAMKRWYLDFGLIRCANCKEFKTLWEFSYTGKGETGHRSSCRSCQARRARDQFRQHPEKRAASSAKWYVSHRAQSLGYAKRYKKAHPEKGRAAGHHRRVRMRNGIIEPFDGLEIFERDDWICQICFEPIDPNLIHPDRMCVTLDHIWPVSKGGPHLRCNAQTAHKSCNSSKYNKMPERVRIW